MNRLKCYDDSALKRFREEVIDTVDEMTGEFSNGILSIGVPGCEEFSADVLFEDGLATYIVLKSADRVIASI